MYVIKNGTTLLDHIVVGHYWGSFSCGKCLAFTTHTVAGMMAHLVSCGTFETEHPKVWSPHGKAHQGSKSGRKSKGKKSKEGTSMEANK